MKFSRIAIVASLAASAWSAIPAASASVLFSQPYAAGEQAYASDSTIDNQVADNFSFASNVSVSYVRWWGNTANETLPATDNFVIRFFADNGSGAPGAQIGGDIAIGDVAESHVTGVYDIAGLCLNVYETGITPIAFSSGQNYYISIVNALNPNDPWMWSFLTRQAVNYFRPTSSDVWDPYGDGDLAFELLSERPTQTPEPASMAVLLSGLAGLAAVRRRRG